MTYLLDDNELILNISVCYAGFVDVVSIYIQFLSCTIKINGLLSR